MQYLHTNSVHLGAIFDKWAKQNVHVISSYVKHNARVNRLNSRWEHSILPSIVLDRALNTIYLHINNEKHRAMLLMLWRRFVMNYRRSVTHYLMYIILQIAPLLTPEHMRQ